LSAVVVCGRGSRTRRLRHPQPHDGFARNDESEDFGEFYRVKRDHV
jgi:hypothetical protein